MENYPWWIAGIAVLGGTANQTLKIILDFKAKMKEIETRTRKDKKKKK